MKKICSILLAIVMAIGVLTTGAFAAEDKEITGILSERFIVDGLGNDVQCLIMILDMPQNFCVTGIDGKTFMAENVEDVQIVAKNYDESMDGSKVKIKSYGEIFEGHTFYHIRPIIINGAELEVVKDNVTVALNGKEINFDQTPIIVDGRTLVPLRAIFEALGATVDWNGDTQTVTSTKDDTTIFMTIGQTEMYKNGEVKALDVVPQIVGGRTLVPVRAIVESFNCDVQWDDINRTVLIATKESAPDYNNEYKVNEELIGCLGKTKSEIQKKIWKNNRIGLLHRRQILYARCIENTNVLR